MNQRILLVCLLPALLFTYGAAPAGTHPATPRYVITDLGGVNGGNSQAFALNDSGMRAVFAWLLPTAPTRGECRQYPVTVGHRS